MPNIKDSDNIPEEFKNYWNNERVRALQKLSMEENLDIEKLQTLIGNYLFTEKKPLRDEVIGMMNERPNLKESKSIAERVTEKVSHAHGQGYADLHFVIPELIDKVNFDKGSSFADKGNFTTAGYVEFKTRNYLESNFAKVEAGQYNTYRLVSGLNLLKTDVSKRDQNLYIAGEGSFSQGYFESPQDFKRFNGIMKYHGMLNENNNLTAFVSGFTSSWNASGQIPDRAVADGTIDFYGAIDNNEGGNTSRYNLNAELTSKGSNNSLFKNQIYVSKYNFELYSNFTFFLQDSVNGDQIRQKEDRTLMGFNSKYSYEFYIGKMKSMINSGIQLRFDNIDNIELTRTKDRIINTEQIMLGDIDEGDAACYYTQRFFLTKKLNVDVGVRYDFFTNKYLDLLSNTNSTSTSSILSPKVNLKYQLDYDIQLFINSGKGFHSNDTRVTVAENGLKVLPPAYGNDAGGIFKIGKKLFLYSTLWYLFLEKEFIYVGDEGIVEAGGQTRRYGVDLAVRYEIIKNLYADFNFNYANPRALNVDPAESYLPLAPIVTSIGRLTYKKPGGLNGSLRYRYMGDRPANETNTVVAEGYFIIDAALNYTTQKWEAGLSIQNLLNSKWKETQFDTESRLRDEPEPVSEIYFTPGTPFFARLNFTCSF